MNQDIYQNMQAAVDIVGSSEHPENKVSASLVGTDKNGISTCVSTTNFWPTPIQETLGTEARIGRSSGTVHAETAAILNLAAQGPKLYKTLEMFVTDVPCPNCVKNMAEAGIHALYIDHKGFEKDFAQRRGHHFEDMSLRICKSAGIPVRRIHRKERTLETILDIPENYRAPEENPVRIFTRRDPAHPLPATYATISAEDSDGKILTMMAEPHPTIGYTSETISAPEDKYSFVMQPINRLLMSALRYGLKIDPNSLISSRVPTSREMVNMIGAGGKSLTIADKTQSRTEEGLEALGLLEGSQILNIQ